MVSLQVATELRTMALALVMDRISSVADQCAVNHMPREGVCRYIYFSHTSSYTCMLHDVYTTGNFRELSYLSDTDMCRSDIW